MDESESGWGVLRVESVERGAEVVVRSTSSSMRSAGTPHVAYVDEDGVVRKRDTDAAFNGETYEVVER